MKTKRVARLLRPSEAARAEVSAAMTREAFDAFAASRGWRCEAGDVLDPRSAIGWAVHAAGWRRGALVVGVKTFDPHRTARDVRRLLVALRRAGVAARPRRR